MTVIQVELYTSSAVLAHVSLVQAAIMTVFRRQLELSAVWGPAVRSVACSLGAP